MAELLECIQFELMAKINVNNTFYDFEMSKISSETFIKVIQQIVPKQILG